MNQIPLVDRKFPFWTHKFPLKFFPNLLFSTLNTKNNLIKSTKRDQTILKLPNFHALKKYQKPCLNPRTTQPKFLKMSQLSLMCFKHSLSYSSTRLHQHVQAPLSTFDCRKFFSRKHITISQYEFCVWDETGDDCAGDIATALFSIHNGRLYLVGLRSYAETDDEVRTFCYFTMWIVSTVNFPVMSL